MNTRFSLEDSVRAAQERTGIPDVAAALHRDGTTTLAGSVETPFRIASVTKSFTATLVAESGLLDERTRALLSHTAGYRPESPQPLPDPCRGLWSYSNAGYWEAAAAFDDYAGALRERVLEPLDLRATGFEEPPGAARGHVQEGETGHRRVEDSSYPAWRRPGGGLWSTVGDLVAYGLAHCRGYAELHEPVADALGAGYALGWWVRDGVLDHEGSVAGYQSLLLLVPEHELVLAVLTNSWRGSGLIRRVVDDLRLLPAPKHAPAAPAEGTYELDGFTAIVSRDEIREREVDPVTGAAIERRRPFSADATLMSWRSDFPRAGVARIGWTAVPRVA